MNALRELVLVLSTFMWIGAGIWIMVHLIAADPAISGPAAAAMRPVWSYVVFGVGVAIFIAATFFWKKRKS